MSSRLSTFHLRLGSCHVEPAAPHTTPRFPGAPGAWGIVMKNGITEWLADAVAVKVGL